MATTARLEYRLLGPLEVLRDGQTLAIKAPKQRALLARLLLSRNEPVSAERLVEDLWSGRPPAKAATALQVYVSHVRKLLEPERGAREEATVLRSQGAGYLLAVADGEFDVDRFERMTGKGHELQGSDPERAASVLTDALGLWRGLVLADFVYEGWAQTEAARLEELRLACLEARLQAEPACGRHTEFVGELEGLVSQYPLRERLRCHLMLALYRSGRQADALQVYQEGREALVEELGLDPSAELQDLNRAILNQDLELNAPVRVEHKQASALPVPSTPLIGRHNELESLARLLHDPDVRLICVTGLGGVGKSRLALEAARLNPEPFPDGLYMVELAATNRPALVLSAIAGALGVSDTAAGEDALMQALKRAMQQQILVVLDNFEHVLAAAPLVAELLGASSALKVLATSRAPLRVSGEREFRIAPFHVPAAETDSDVEGALNNAAVQLFLERAYPDETVDPGTADVLSIASICRRVDGIPLAIELAAARTRLFTPAELLPELDLRMMPILVGGSRDRPERQQALRDTIRWSYDLLTPREQRLFARLAVFTGGFTLAYAAAVCDAALEELEALAEHSLIAGLTSDGRTRFSMLETIREFALERLIDNGEEATLRRRHLEEIVRTLGDAVTTVRPPIPAETWSEIAAELDNIRGALAWAAADGDAALGVDLAASLTQFWNNEGLLTEGLDWLRALHSRSDELDDRRRGRLTYAIGYLEMTRGEYGHARDLLGSAVEILTTAGDLRGVSRTHSAISYAASWQGVLSDARDHAEEARTLAERLNDALALADAERSLAAVCEEEGDFDRSTRHWERSAELYRDAGDESAYLSCDANLGWGLLLAGAHSDAEPILRRAIARTPLTWVGVLQIFRENLAACLMLQGRPDEARPGLAFVLSSSTRSFQERVIAEALVCTAALAAHDGNEQRAARLFGASEGLLAHMVVEPSPVERAVMDAYLGAFEPGKADTESIRGDGRALSVDVALAEALEVVMADSVAAAGTSN